MHTIRTAIAAVVVLFLGCGGTMPSGSGCPSGCPANTTCQGNACVPNGGGTCSPACQAGFTCQGTTCIPDMTGCSPSCRDGFTCQGTTCMLDSTGSWVITVTSGQVSERKADGSCWDSPCGLPDPYVCLTINGSKKCTPTANDTLQPSWNSSFPAATATALQSGVGIEYMDEDLADDDVICTGNQAISATSFVSGTWGITCSNTTSRFSATLSPR